MAQAASKTCEVCVSAPGSQYCIDCEEYYCENCKLLHNRQKLSRNHQFQKASENIPETKSRCSEHKEEVSFMCSTCTVLVCASCVTGNHNGHTFSKLVDVIAKLRVENETQIHVKTNEANQNMKQIEDNLKSFEYGVDSVINAIIKRKDKIKRMIDKSVAEMITLVKNQSKKQKEKLMLMLSDSKSLLVAGQTIEKKRQELDKTRHDGTMVQQIKNLNKEINELQIDSLPTFPKISFNRKSVTEDAIKQLLGNYTISNCLPIEEKKTQQHGDLFRCSFCGYEEIKRSENLIDIYDLQ